MPLPKIATPTYELELPSTEETIKFRPLVKEKNFLFLHWKVKILNKLLQQSKT